MDLDQDLRAALRGVLDAVENASPVQAVEAATRGLGVALGALSVSFLIADLSGRALVRLSYVAAPGGARTGGPDDDRVTAVGGGSRRDMRELADMEPLDGGPSERALRTQVVQVLPPWIATAGDRPSGDGWTVLAPVTERGEALGLLELVLPADPSAAEVAEIARTAHLLGFVVVASRRHTDLLRVGAAQHPVLPLGRDPAPAASTRVHVRGPARSRCPHGSNPRPASAGTPTTTALLATCCTCP